ncbi:MAG: hypothetical protein AB7O49_11830 [Sphingomonadales bacterium]
MALVEAAKAKPAKRGSQKKVIAMRRLFGVLLMLLGALAGLLAVYFLILLPEMVYAAHTQHVVWLPPSIGLVSAALWWIGRRLYRKQNSN